MKTKQCLLRLAFVILAFYFGSPSSYTQSVGLPLLSVQARVLEQLKGNIKSVPNANLKMVGLGDYATDSEGRFAFQISMEELLEFDNQMVIKIVLPDYEIIRPYQGKVQLDTSSSEVYLDILVMGRDIEEEYREKLTELSNKLRITERKNSISLKRISAMNDSLVIALQEDAEQQIELKKSIEKLKERADQEADQKSKIVAELENAQLQMQRLNSSLKNKEDELFIALEEKYLRQQKYQKSISSDLKNYLINVKDVQDILQNLDNYFKPAKYPNYTSTYNRTLQSYNNIFIKINDNHLDYIQGVNRYWENGLLADQVQETFEMLFDQVHHPILKPAIGEVNNHIRKNKSGKASKVGHKAFHDLNPLIINLEKAVNRLVDKL